MAGSSVAYHLAKLGWQDVLVLEQHELTEGTTWHSAGFVGQLRSTVSQTRMLMYSSALYGELEAETGRDPGWRAVGGLRLATTPERVEELRRQESAAATYGLQLDLLDARQTAQRLPLLQVDDVLAAAWLPGDGYLDPAPLALALAEGARRQGVVFHEHTRVSAIDLDDRGRVSTVHTADGARVATEVVVVACGAASGVVGRLAGARIPVVPMRHQYVVTEPLDPAVPPQATTVRDPDRIVYFRPEAGGLLVGGYAREPATYDADVPLTDPRTLFDDDPQRFAESWEGAKHRVPALQDVGLAKVVNGPEAFTPDGEFLLGETETPGLWVAAGFCVHGLAGAGGVGKVMAEWIVDGQPEWDVAGMDVRRFGAHDRIPRHARVRALEAYSKYYDVVYPHEERRAGRPLRRSPAYAQLDALGARFGEKAGWERANWFAPNAHHPAANIAQRPRGWAGQHWSPAIAAEASSTSMGVTLFDQSSFAKLDVRGPGAATALSWICAGDVDRDPGIATYTQLLNPRGGIEADLTVTRLERDHFRVVTGTSSGGRDLAWIRRHLPADGSVRADDVTSSLACFCLWGPWTRRMLQPWTDESLAHVDFPFLRAKEIGVGGVPVLAQRITYVGELGWELYCPAEYGATLWELLWAAGQDFQIVAGGYRAIDSLRLEKGYRVWGSDITPDTTPDETGLAFAVKTGKAGGFLGRDALLRARDSGPPTRALRCLVLDDPQSVCLGNEPVRAGGEPLGRITSGGVGYRVGKSIAYALLPAEVGVGDLVQVGVFGEWVDATVTAEPLYDPAGDRIRSAT